METENAYNRKNFYIIGVSVLCIIWSLQVSAAAAAVAVQPYSWSTQCIQTFIECELIKWKKFYVFARQHWSAPMSSKDFLKQLFCQLSTWDRLQSTASVQYG